MEKTVEKGRLESVASRLLGVSRTLTGPAKDKVYLAACWVQSAHLPCSYQDWTGFHLPVESEGKILQTLEEALVVVNTEVVSVERHPLLEQAAINIQEAFYLLKRLPEYE